MGHYLLINERKPRKGEAIIIAEYNRAYTTSIRHAVGQRVMLDARELQPILVAAHATASGWVRANFGQCNCAGSGTFSKKGAIGPNGIHVVTEEVCFGCGGKGYQDADDQRRNYGYWAYYANVSV